MTYDGDRLDRALFWLALLMALALLALSIPRDLYPF